MRKQHFLIRAKKASWRAYDVVSCFFVPYLGNIARLATLLCKLPDCEAPFKSPSELYLHIRADHKNIKYTCARCNAEFKAKYDLDCHSKRKKKCQLWFSKKEKDKIVSVEAHLADIDSQINTVAALISGLDSVECEDCYLNK